MSLVLTQADSGSSLGQCFPLRVRRDHHGIDLRRHRVRVQCRQQCSMADDVLLGYEYGLPATVRTALRHVWKENLLLRFHHCLHGWLLWLFGIPNNPAARYHERPYRIRRRRTYHNGYLAPTKQNRETRSVLTSSVATVINSDMIPFRQRGMYQAMQNILVGFGAVLGASLGGVITDTIGWRWCFLAQVPVSMFALMVGYHVLVDPEHSVMKLPKGQQFRSALRRVDLSGATLLVVGLVVQLFGLSLGGNEFPWGSSEVKLALVTSTVLLGGFMLVEAKTKAVPMIPLQILKGWQPQVLQLTNVFVGMASYAVGSSQSHALRLLTS